MERMEGISLYSADFKGQNILRCDEKNPVFVSVKKLFLVSLGILHVLFANHQYVSPVYSEKLH